MKLIKLQNEDVKEYKILMQEAFQYGFESVFGKEQFQVLPEKDIDESLNNPNCHAYEMLDDQNNIIGGAIVEINQNNINGLHFLFVKVGVQSKGVGQRIWHEIEILYPETKVWKTCTPYFDKRNIHFYVNKLKFKIVEYFNLKHPDPRIDADAYEGDDGMFEFEKEMLNR